MLFTGFNIIADNNPIFFVSLINGLPPPSRPRSRWERLKNLSGCLWTLPCLISFLCFALSPTDLSIRMEKEYGHEGVDRLEPWLSTLRTAAVASEQTQLRTINDFVNKTILFDSDAGIWRQPDYWATPFETLGQGRGDCEDFAIIKYVSLRIAGVDEHKLRLIYVKATLQGISGPIQQAHMVLAYYPTPRSEPLLLDNLNPTILPASRRKDLRPVFSFNAEGIFAGVSPKLKPTPGGAARLSRWENVLQRIVSDAYPGFPALAPSRLERK